MEEIANDLFGKNIKYDQSEIMNIFCLNRTNDLEESTVGLTTISETSISETSISVTTVGGCTIGVTSISVTTIGGCTVGMTVSLVSDWGSGNGDWSRVVDLGDGNGWSGTVNDGIESVDGVSGVGNGTDGTIGFNKGVLTANNITVSGLGVSVLVSGESITDRVTEVVLWVSIVWFWGNGLDDSWCGISDLSWGGISNLSWGGIGDWTSDGVVGNGNWGGTDGSSVSQTSGGITTISQVTSIAYSAGSVAKTGSSVSESSITSGSVSVSNVSGVSVSSGISVSETSRITRVSWGGITGDGWSGGVTDGWSSIGYRCGGNDGSAGAEGEGSSWGLGGVAIWTEVTSGGNSHEGQN